MSSGEHATESAEDGSHPTIETLARWLRGEIADAEAAGIESHLESCDACAKKLESIDSPPDSFVQRLRASGVTAEAATVTSQPDANLYFGAIALQAGLITAQQLADASVLLMSRGGGSMADLLVAQGWLDEPARASVSALLAARGPKPPKRAAAETLAGREVSGIALTDSHELPHGPNSRVQLKELHSQGGIGQVWRAYDTVLGREVALKELLPELRGSKRHRERFYREARVAAQLTHPGTAPVYEYREEGGRYYYTMKFFSGRTLTEVIRDKHAAAYEGERVAFDRLFPLLDHFLVVCDAIAYAHAKGIVHRDLKGENVVLGAYGEVTVIDWGLAKSISRAEGRIKTSETNRSETPTLEGERLGTPGFMAPEQARGELSAIDERTDVYGLAAILYEILTKRAPFSGETANEIMHQVETVAPASPSLTHPLTPPELEAICLKGLAKKKEDRFQSARELRHAVHEWIAGQAQLQREAAEQAKFFSLSRDLFVTLDATGDITHVNEAYQRLLRYQGDAPRGVHYAETLHPDDRERAAAVFSSAQRGLSEQDLILRVRYADEGYCPISWSVTRALDEPTIYAVGRPLDEASERRRRAKVVQTLFSLSSDLFVMIDEAGCFAHVNPACNRALGYEHDEMLGEPFAEFLHPEDQQRRQQTFEDTLAGKSVQDYASRMRRADGGYLLTRWTSAKVPGEPMVYAVGRVLDEAAERRRRAEQLEAFFELSSDLFVSFGDDARVSYANPAYSRLMGRPLDDTIGRTLLERVHPDDRAGTQRVYERAMQGEPTTDFKARIVRHDGEYQPAVWSVAKTIGEPSVYAIGRPLDPESESRRLAAERARFFDLSRDLFVAFDSEGNITHTNPAYEQFFGYSNARSLGKSHRTKVHPDELAYLEERVQSVMSGKPVDDFTLRVEDDNGVYRPVSWSLTKAPGEKVIYAVGRPIDEQTERRRRTEARARFFALSSDVCIAIDPDGSISQVNQAWTDLLGFSPDRTIGKQAIKRVHPDDQQYVARLIESVKQGDSVQDIIIRQENNDGVYVTINWTLSRVAGEQTLYAIGRPLDEQSERRREMQARARFFAFSPDLFVISDDQGKAAQINEAWRHVLGWTSDDVIGNSFIDFVHPDDVGPATRAGRRALLREAVVNLETRVRCRDGSYRVIEWTLCRLPGDRVNYALGRDITESKHAEERLRAILDSGPEALLVVSSEGVIEFANRVLCRLFGYEHATLEGQPIESLMPEEFRERHREVFADYMKAPTVRSMGRGAKFPAVREDGSRFLAQISLSPLHLSGGSLSILAAVQPFYENKAN